MVVQLYVVGGRRRASSVHPSAHPPIHPPIHISTHSTHSTQACTCCWTHGIWNRESTRKRQSITLRVYDADWGRHEGGEGGESGESG